MAIDSVLIERARIVSADSLDRFIDLLSGFGNTPSRETLREYVGANDGAAIDKAFKAVFQRYLGGYTLNDNLEKYMALNGFEADYSGVSERDAIYDVCKKKGGR
ncbi:hypothetical protein AGMMS49975_11020 [Clostridia bacterium]|nr:hypothetical protein AGMMS49975_11020 [Clostridia bacterium]